MSRTAAVSLFRQYIAARRSACSSFLVSGSCGAYELNGNGAEAKKEGDKYGESVEAESEKREEGSSSSSVEEESDATQSQQNGAKTLTRTIRHAPTGVVRREAQIVEILLWGSKGL
ncbi:hypothetical protein ACEPAF_1429 [Sanghuangporus sanghuang]